MRQRIFYGEFTDAEDFNLRGRPYLVFDGAGLLAHDAYDFKGNLLESRRRLATAYQTEPTWSALNSSTATSAEGDASSVLESDELTQTLAYDALNRPTSLVTPDDSEQLPTYGVSGLLSAWACDS